MENDKTDNGENFEALEKEIREAVAKGVHTRETVRRLTLNAMNAQHIDLASLQRIVAAIMHGIHDGAEEQIQHVISQTQTAKTQINEAVTGLDSALAGFAQASKLAVEEAASQAKKFSENELTRTHSELESLESLFLDTLHDTASAAQGLVADILHDVIRHAKNNGTAVGLQLVETLVTFKHQIASIGHAQLESSATLANATAELIGKVASGVLSGINEQVENSKYKH
ncbi:MAG: hypothetical protein LM517_01810 [Nitrosomonas sp.]|nr:hypothetical protein [Nitrosomonas sp.]